MAKISENYVYLFSDTDKLCSVREIPEITVSTQILAHPVTQVNRDTALNWFLLYIMYFEILNQFSFTKKICNISLSLVLNGWTLLFWFSLIYLIPTVMCCDAVDVLGYYMWCVIYMSVILLVQICKVDFDTRVVCKQAGYLPKQFDEREELKYAISQTKWFKKSLQTYDQALSYIRKIIVPPTSSERCYADGHILCVFRVRNRPYLVKFEQKGMCTQLDDAFALLANDILMSKFGTNVIHQSDGLLSTLRLTDDDNYEDIMYSIYLCVRFWQTKQMDYLYALFRLFRRYSNVIQNVGSSGLKRVMRIIRRFFIWHQHGQALLLPEYSDDDESSEDGGSLEEFIASLDNMGLPDEVVPPRVPLHRRVEQDCDHDNNGNGVRMEVYQSGIGFSTILGAIHGAKNIITDRGFISLITIVTGTLVLLTGHKFNRRNLEMCNSFNSLLHTFTDHVCKTTELFDAPKTILGVAENALECVHLLYKKYVKGDYVLSYDEVTKFRQTVASLRGTTIPEMSSGFDMVDYSDSGPLFDLSWKYMYNGQETSYNEMIDIITKTYNDGKKVKQSFVTGHASSSMAHIQKDVEHDFSIIEKIYNKMTKDLANQTGRVAPFATLVHGASGIGKSRIMQHLIDVVCGVAKVPNKSQYIYTVQDGQKFWNGFTSCVHTIIFDDLGAAKQSNFDPNSPVPMILRVVNDVAFVPDQAALENKGQHYCQPLHVIASSNYKHCNVHEFMHHKGATLRRMPIVITPTVKEQYRLSGGALDTTKTNDRADDYHTFLVERCLAVEKSGNPHGDVKYERIDFTDSSGVRRIKNGMCESLLDLKVFYAESANKYFEGLWTHKHKFAVRCPEHDQLVPCYRCALRRGVEEDPNAEIQVVQHEMGRIPPPSVENASNVTWSTTRFVSKMRAVAQSPLSSMKWLVTTALFCCWIGIADWILHAVNFYQGLVVRARAAINNTLTGYSIIHWALISIVNINDIACDCVRWAFIICYPSRYVGQIYTHIQRHRIIYYGLVTATFVALLYSVIKGLKLFNTLASQTLTNNNGVEAPVNPWNTNVKNIYVGEGSRCAAGSARDSAIRGLLNRCVSITSVNDSMQTTTVARGIFLSSNIIMTVAHFVDRVGVDENGEIRVCVILNSMVPTQRFRCSTASVISARVIRKAGAFTDDKDIVFLQITSGSGFNFTDITGSSRGDFFFDDEGEVTELYSYLVTGDNKLSLVSNRRLTTSGVFDLYQYESPHPTQQGDSGSLIIGITKRQLPVIVGLHVGISTRMFSTKPTFAYVCKRNLTDFLHRITPINMATHQNIVINSDNVTNRSLASGVCPHVERDEEENVLHFANVNIIGEVKGMRQDIRATSFKISDEAPFVEKFANENKIELKKLPPNREVIKDIAISKGYSTQQIEAINKSWPSINWWYHNMSLIRPLATGMRIKRCCDLFLNHILSNLGERKIEQMRSYVRVLSLDEAINGVIDDPNVGGLNINTSTGFPFFTKKIDALPYIRSDSVRRTLSSEPMMVRCGGEKISPMDDYLETLDAFKNNSRSGKPFVSRYKDEAIAVDKLVLRGRRLFMNGPMSVTICIRQYYLMLVTFIKTYALDFQCVYGINASSTAWKKVYQRLNKHKMWNDGDFQAFDVNISSELLSSIGNRILIPLLRMCPGYDSVPDSLLTIMLTECTNALVLVDNDLMLLNGMNPSGNPLTTIFNCFANVVYHMIAFEDIFSSDKLNNFFKEVELLTYGDDSNYTTDNDVYNCDSVSKALEVYGITYTNSQKIQGLKFTPKANIAFLQRSYVEDKDNDIVLAPLNKSSILRSIHLTDISVEDQHVRWQGVLNSWWYESFHFICGFGEKLRGYLREMAERKGLIVPTLNREMWLEQYHNGSLQWLKFHFGDDLSD